MPSEPGSSSSRCTSSLNVLSIYPISLNFILGSTNSENVNVEDDNENVNVNDFIPMDNDSNYSQASN